MNSCCILLLLLLCNSNSDCGGFGRVGFGRNGRNCNDQNYYDTNRGGRNRNDGNRGGSDCGCENDRDDDYDYRNNESRFDTRTSFGNSRETHGCEEDNE